MHTETTEHTEYQLVLNLSVLSVSVWDKKGNTERTDGHGYQWVQGKGTRNARKPQKMLTSREIISVSSVSSFRFAPVKNNPYLCMYIQ